MAWKQSLKTKVAKKVIQDRDASTAANVQAEILEAGLDAKLTVGTHQIHTHSHSGAQVGKPGNEKV